MKNFMKNSIEDFDTQLKSKNTYYVEKRKK